MAYRNRVYGLNLRWPESRMKQILYAIRLFRANHNGFRDIAYYRLGRSKISRLLSTIYKRTSNLVLDCGSIAEGGCMFHHAFSTYINAEHVGFGCSFRNNITVGNKLVNGKLRRPVFKDHVFVGPNSVIIGDIIIGEHSIIAPGSVVVKDVPPYSVVGGNPAKVIKVLPHNEAASSLG